ncbi:MAG: hypothetical protein ACK47D_12745 [Pseudanabaena sp.]|jgi:hypothetical protein|uniref:hypothetical protein n=1 Tax=Cyanophyceae TaxID=3028117 RepID=UPI002576A643|nr:MULTISPECIES: hypothetical protein [Cyanophyceae]MCA6574299.1 hypothetical protein [Pseudanabaena sp. M53BS1SP1A06MG]MCA6581431.1 hypothetical protein [Pseudanabaena sp. M34BS1SP1A06MG]MCA6591254.1 hypothetical protein [Pseudanabaena sp. M38BS1SP1A06MG]MCA6594788.1 hypothetical protein [Pseudanabaena sp. M046S1SP1A06QC]MCA6601734.1 hypothetical protein [Pseudanabaena sp. M57BS1SP1A06MG]MCA6624292.1 hypothetical protein [Pseudanabaena sp. M165S2SP1A06QC]
MEILTDYQNRQIRLTEERLQHILDHPEMVDMRSQLEIVLQTPEVVRQSRSDSKVYLYYRFYEQTIVGAKWLCVVIKDNSNDAFVITAYLTDKLKQGLELWRNL